MEENIIERILDGSVRTKDLPLETLRKITDNFSENRIIGEGGFGTVYKGILRNGNAVAVKRIMSSMTINEELFRREVDSLMEVNHQNVVKFIGFCSNTTHTAVKIAESQQYIYAEVRERLLCFEYITNGSLDRHITDELRGIEWDTRYNVIKGICTGLHYLHMEKGILHMDLKPANILLDNQMVPKITDFGLSRPTERSQTTSVNRFSTPGYTAPENLFGHGRMSVKSDIYSLGTIILELVTGRKSIPDDHNNVLRRWRHRWNKLATETPIAYQQQVMKCLEIGIMCHSSDPYKRPFISDIMNTIRNFDEPTISQITSTPWEDDMLRVEPLELRFANSEHNDSHTFSSCSIELSNNTNGFIAFNVQTNSPLPYQIDPNNTIVQPQSKVSVMITLPEATQYHDRQYKEQFIVRSTKVNEDLATKDINKDMFDKVKDIDEVNLAVVSHAQLETPSCKELAREDPITIGGKGWGISAIGWLISPIISRVLNKGFSHLDINTSEKLKILDIKVLQLQRVMEVVDESTYRFRLEPLLDKLKSAFYEAEDILDRVEYQRLEKQIQDSKSDAKILPSGALKDEGSGILVMELKDSLKKIENAISGACAVLDQLNLPSVSNHNRIRAVAANLHTAGTTAGPPLRVIGRDQDRDNIIAMLHEKKDQFQANTISGAGYSVIGIHGIAGSGKSTLAQCIYDYENMDGHFDIVMWIHVSQKFSLYSTFSEMLEGVTRKESPKFSSLNVLKESLEKELRGKRILLVLDDVWFKIDNSEDREELQRLISPLNVGKTGSRILVTSRTEAALVALGVTKERCLPISELDEEVFFEMFKHYAFRDAKIGDDDGRILEMLAEDIAKKLKRSPLAARTVGSRLHDNLNVDFWRSEKNRDLLNSTMGALWWSYQYLDEQVRRCFAYCSIFPRRHRLRRDELVKLWVAEGFIKTSRSEEEMEDIARSYFNELVSASFLQLGGKEKTGFSEHDNDYFTIHDLLYDLAKEVAGTDCFRIEKDFTGEVPKDVRYLFVVSYNRKMLTEKISGLQNLRSLIISEIIRLPPTEYKLFASMFTKLTELQKLRVLKICVVATDADTFSFSFPDSIAKWKHLRYFGFEMYCSGNESLTLPGAFTKLYHMQVVNFGSFASLVIPEDTVNLVNLRHVTGVCFDIPNIGKMTWLDALSVFTIRKKQGYEPRQLKHLNRLQGNLGINGLENIQSKEEALEINLAGKEKLTALALNWGDSSCSPDVEAEVLEGLCPSKYLERLQIWRYHGVTLPNWMMGEHSGGPKNLKELKFFLWSQQGPGPDLGAFIHLLSIYLSFCYWDALPGMEHLTSLKILKINYCKNMRSFGKLPRSLEVFTVKDCNPELKQLCDDYWSESRKD